MAEVTISVADKATLDSVNSKVTTLVNKPYIKYNATAQETQVYDPVNDTYVKLETGGGGSQIELLGVTLQKVISDLNVINGEPHVRNILTWVDPADATSGSTVLANWAGTRVVRKAGSAPTGPNDGDIVCDNKVRSKYNGGYYYGSTSASGGASIYIGSSPSSIKQYSLTGLPELPKGAMASRMNNGNDLSAINPLCSFLEPNAYCYYYSSGNYNNWYYYQYFIDDDESLEFDTTYYYAFFPYTTNGVFTDVRRSNPVSCYLEFPSWETAPNKVVYRALQLTNDGYIDTYDDLGWRTGDTRDNRYTLVQYRPKTKLIQDIKIKGGNVTNYANWAVWDRKGPHWADISTTMSYESRFSTYQAFMATSAMSGIYNTAYASSYIYSSDYTFNRWNGFFGYYNSFPVRNSNGTEYYDLLGSAIGGWLRNNSNYYSSHLFFYPAITQTIKNDYIMLKGLLSFPSAASRTQTGYSNSSAWIDFNGTAYIKRSFISYERSTSTIYQYESGWTRDTTFPLLSSYYIFSKQMSVGAYGVCSPFEVNGSFTDIGWNTSNAINYYNGMTETEKNQVFTSNAQFDYFKTEVNKPSFGSYSYGAYGNVFQVGPATYGNANFSSCFVPQTISYLSSYFTSSHKYDYSMYYYISYWNNKWQQYNYTTYDKGTSYLSSVGIFYMLI